jgi:hypothetical protein
MTSPPTGPYEQSTPDGPHGSSPLSARPPAGGQPPPADSEEADAPQFEPWATRPDPWNQRDLCDQQSGGLPESGDTPPRRNRTRLITGIVVAVVVLVGGGVAAIALLTGNNTNTAAPTTAPGAGDAPAHRSSPEPVSRQDPASVAQALVQSIDDKDIPRYANLLCIKPKRSLMDELKVDWDGDSTLHAGLDERPAVTGTQATVTVRMTYRGQPMRPVLRLKQQGSAWCADIPT